MTTSLQRKQGRKWWLRGKPSVTFSEALLESNRTREAELQISSREWLMNQALPYSFLKEDSPQGNTAGLLQTDDYVSGLTPPSTTISSPSNGPGSLLYTANEAGPLIDSSLLSHTITSLDTRSLIATRIARGLTLNPALDNVVLHPDDVPMFPIPRLKGWGNPLGSPTLLKTQLSHFVKGLLTPSVKTPPEKVWDTGFGYAQTVSILQGIR